MALRIASLMLLAWLAKVLRPLVTIRFGTLFVSRLGHLAGNTECYLCERDAGLNRAKRTFDIWTPQGTPANAHLLAMYRRVMPIWRWAFGVQEVGKHLQGWNAAHTFSDSQWGRDIHNLIEKSPPHLTFTRAEEKRGRTGLRALGMPAKWVCIINRDPMYLRAVAPGQDYTYHSFRDSDIDNYCDAAVALIQRGYWVLRMGTFVEKRMALSGPQFIDYACSGMRSDFMDVYLGAKCAFTISNGTGFDGIPMIFRRPICFVNEAPFEYLSTWMKDSLAIWKHHLREGKRMSVAEIIASGAGLFSRSGQFEDAGITLEENTPTEIKDVALEMDDRLQGIHSVLADDALQARFWAAYPRSKSPANGGPLHGEIRLRIGSKFLTDYAD
jgi:putative glycosyltransferase (TIGR04372 family)